MNSEFIFHRMREFFCSFRNIGTSVQMALESYTTDWKDLNLRFSIGSILVLDV
jgi:hypothetical protein